MCWHENGTSLLLNVYIVQELFQYRNESKEETGQVCVCVCLFAVQTSHLLCLRRSNWVHQISCSLLNMHVVVLNSWSRIKSQGCKTLWDHNSGEGPHKYSKNRTCSHNFNSVLRLYDEMRLRVRSAKTFTSASLSVHQGLIRVCSKPIMHSEVRRMFSDVHTHAQHIFTQLNDLFAVEIHFPWIRKSCFFFFTVLIE